MTVVPFPHGQHGDLLAGALAAGIAALHELDAQQAGLQSAEMEEAAAVHAIQPLLSRVSSDRRIVDVVVAALVQEAVRRARPTEAW